MNWFVQKKTRIYYVSGDGDDRNQGTHPSLPWATINRVIRQGRKFRKGDTILFERGFSYSGISMLNKLTAKNPEMVIGVYGSGEYPIFQV